MHQNLATERQSLIDFSTHAQDRGNIRPRPSAVQFRVGRLVEDRHVHKMPFILGYHLVHADSMFVLKRFGTIQIRKKKRAAFEISDVSHDSASALAPLLTVNTVHVGLYSPPVGVP